MEHDPLSGAHLPGQTIAKLPGGSALQKEPSPLSRQSLAGWFSFERLLFTCPGGSMLGSEEAPGFPLSRHCLWMCEQLAQKRGGVWALL